MQTSVQVASPSAQNAARWVNPYLTYEGRTRKFKAPIPNLAPRFVLLEEGETLTRFFHRYADNVEVERVTALHEICEVVRRAPAQAVILNAPPGAFTSAETTAFLADLPYGTPVMSCWIQASDEVARSLGVTQYLVKPINRETLLGALQAIELPGKLVLLVDDQPEILQLFSRILSSGSETYQVIRARDGQQALDLLRARKPDVMLLDLVLDKMDGFEVIKEMREDPAIRDIPVIVISSLDPTGSPVVSDSLTVQHKGGLSVRELLGCIRTVSQTLAPHPQPAGPASRPDFPA